MISLSTATPLSTQLRFVQAGGVALIPVTAATSLQQVRELFAQLDQLEGVERSGCVPGPRVIAGNRVSVDGCLASVRVSPSSLSVG